MDDVHAIEIAEPNEIPSLAMPAQFIPGVGPARAALLERLELRTVEDVLFNMPRDVLDLSKMARVKELRADTPQTVRGMVVDRDAKLTRTGKTMTAVLLDCGDGYVRGLWFNQPWM